MRPMLTVRAVAERLSVQRATVRRWIRAGTLPAVKLGTKQTAWRIRPEALERFLSERETTGR